MTNDPLIGKQLANFRLERPLGRGGMASVYYGTDVVLQRPVAVKVIDARHRHKPEYARRLVQEARAVAQWRQENIVQVYYADSEDDLFYFVMEYINGSDLRQLLTNTAPALLPPSEALRIGRGIAAALDYAHARGAIHRDVKPENVMLDADGRVVLTDFGLVIEADGHQTGESFGSAAYIAPEQARSETPTVAQSDLYALGVMLFEMLTGHLPFDDPSAMSAALQHVTQPPPSPRAFNPALNEQTEAVLLKALSKLPAQRYQTGGDLMAALERALGDSGGAMDELVGRQLDEYRLEALLGQGGMARIYRAHDVRLKRDVAVKVIDASLRADREYRERFEREAQAIAQLSHPHIVNVFRYGEVDGQFYLAMQYVDGSDLRHKLNGIRRAQTYMPLPDILRIIRQMGDALDYAHSKGIIHRDVKPANILLNNAGQIFLSDFGLVLRSDTATRGQVFGSPRYVAPEQAMSSAAAVPQSDLYALGIILYEMLTNRTPFDGRDPLNVAMMHMTETPPPPREIRPELSPALEKVVLKALEKEPQARYASGREMAAALAAAIEAKTPPVYAAAAPMPAAPPPDDLGKQNGRYPPSPPP
jgi:eukaryotic-like serine/threonine-protein kinase